MKVPETVQRSTATRLPLQWHPAFYAGLQIEFEKDAANLIFENEHQLGTKPKEIDILITKKNPSIPTTSNLGKIFRKYNIIEYKSPMDYPSIDDFNRAFAYACFYKADTPHVNEISLDEITLTLICQSYPQKLMQHLEEAWNCKVVQAEPGIYYVLKHVFPIQIILISKLSMDKNFWLHSLTNTIPSEEALENLVTEYEKHKDNKLYQSVMDIIVRANPKTFRGGKFMCQAIIDLAIEISSDPTNPFTFEPFEKARAEGLKQGIRQGIEQGITQGIEQGIEQGITQGIEQGIEQGRIQSFIETYQELGISLSQTLSTLKTKFSLNETAANGYMNRYWQ